MTWLKRWRGAGPLLLVRRDREQLRRKNTGKTRDDAPTRIGGRRGAGALRRQLPAELEPPRSSWACSTRRDLIVWIGQDPHDQACRSCAKAPNRWGGRISPVSKRMVGAGCGGALDEGPVALDISWVWAEAEALAEVAASDTGRRSPPAERDRRRSTAGDRVTARRSKDPAQGRLPRGRPSRARPGPSPSSTST